MSDSGVAMYSVQSSHEKDIFLRKKKSKKDKLRLRKRTQRIILQPVDPPKVNQPGMRGDIWELDKMSAELDDLAVIVEKRNQSNKSKAFGLRKSFQNWRDGKLREQFQSQMDSLLSKITTSEESVRLWLSAIVMKKWECRCEAMTFINELDATIALHEFRLDTMDEELEEVRSHIKVLTTEARHYATMLVFNEALDSARYIQDDTTEDEDENEDDSSDDGFVSFSQDTSRKNPVKLSKASHCRGPYTGFNSYNGKRLDVSVCLGEGRISRWNATFDTAWQSYMRKGRNEPSGDLHDEIAQKLKDMLIAIEKWSQIKLNIKKAQRNEIIILAIANRAKNTLKSVSGFEKSTKVIHFENKSDSVVNIDGRRFFVPNDDDSDGSGVSDGGFQRGALNDHFTSRREQRQSLRHMAGCEKQLLILAKAENDAKDTLVKLIELKAECEELIMCVQDDDDDVTKRVKGEGRAMDSVVGGIIWGSAGVATPMVAAEPDGIGDDDYVDVGSSRLLKLCRNLSKDVKVKFDDLQQLKMIDKPLCNEDKSVRTVEENINNTHDGCCKMFIKELQDQELSTILSSLHADKVYLDRGKCAYFPEYFEFQRNFDVAHQASTVDSEMIDRQDRNSSSSLTDSIHYVSNLLGGIISGNSSETYSDEDGEPNSTKDGRDSSTALTGFGIIFKPSTETIDRQDYCMDPLERTGALYVGKSDIFCIYVSDATFRAVLSGLSFRDYLDSEGGISVPVMAYNAEKKEWIGLYEALQRKIVFSFADHCDRSICGCTDTLCECPSLPMYSPPAMSLNLNKYVAGAFDVENATDDNAGDNTDTYCLGHLLQLMGSWKCSYGDKVDKLFENRQRNSKKNEAHHQVWSLIEVGIINSAASQNAEGAVHIIRYTASELFSFSSSIIKQSEECAFRGGLRSQLIRYTLNNGNVVAPFEEVVSHVFSVLSKHCKHIDKMHTDINKRSRFDKLSDMLIPLGAVRIILASVLLQTTRRVNQACTGLDKWISLSSSVAFRVMSSFYTPTFDSDSSSDDNSDAAVLGIYGDDDEDSSESNNTVLFHSLLANKKSNRSVPSKNDKMLLRKKRNGVDFFIKKKTDDLDAILHMRIPILGSVGVKVRAELYQDLLDLQIRASSGQHHSCTVFGNGHDLASNERDSDNEICDKKLMAWGLCRLIVSLQEEQQYQVDKDEIRKNMRFHLLQYLLGLDERWTLNQTADACRLVIECFGINLTDNTSSNYLLNQKGGTAKLPPALNYSESSAGALHFAGQKSTILSEASLNILTRVIPPHLFSSTCSVRFSVATGGGSLISLLHATATAPYRACLLVIKDSVGHVFGGFVDQQLKTSREYFGNGECFVFSVFPSTKIYRWTKRNNYFVYLTEHNLGMGGGGKGFSFLLDEDLSQGSSCSSETFQNPTLSFTEQFQCTEFEVIVFA